MEKLIDNIFIDIHKSDKEILSYSMLSLAFLGDSIHSAFIRGKLVNDKCYKVKELHSKATKFVKASSQSYVLENILENLTDEEKRIVNSSRNAKSNNIAKNASIKDYKNATSLESLFGFLALSNNFERLNLLLNLSYDIIKNKENL